MSKTNFDFASNFAKNLKHLRQEKNISFQKLANDVGLSRTTLSHYENGNRLPEFESIVKLSLYFECSIDELVFNGTPIDISELREIDTVSDIDTLISDKELIEHLFNRKLLLQQYSNEINNKLNQINTILNIVGTQNKKK